MSHIMVEFLYAQEVYECSRQNGYMGLWQIAQAASVLNVPIISVYPEGGDEIFRLDFHRKFYPVERKPNDCNEEKIIIMWTGMNEGEVPNHFVPLLPKRPKYGHKYFKKEIFLFICLY